jgi:hypothetical protein
MPLSNKPAATSLQVGNTGYFLRDGAPAKGVIEFTESDTSENPVNTEVTLVRYKFIGIEQWYPASKVYSSKSALKSATETATDAL